jgi:hypothetical protein
MYCFGSQLAAFSREYRFNAMIYMREPTQQGDYS